MVRKAIVSGQFYPADEKRLKELITDFTPKETAKISAKGIILPHAGYVYSGRVAVTTVAKVLRKKRLIILGPNHSGLGPSFSLWSKGSWQTPLGNIDIDEELAGLILNKGTHLEEDASAHNFEHSIEVELPILKHFFADFKFVPIVCMPSGLEKYREVSNQIVKAIKGIEKDVLLVASTDMTHYEPEACARAKDRLAIEAIVNLDEQALTEKVASENISMCGLAPAAVLIACLKAIGARKSQVALYQTSAVRSGDYESVVGYVGVIIK